jgi:hypothetical protein
VAARERLGAAPMSAPDAGRRPVKPRRPHTGQSPTWSAIESGTTMFVGYLCAVLFYQIVWPLFGYQVQIADSAAVALLMFPVNYVRQYVVRRAFNWMQHREGNAGGGDAPVTKDVSSPYE